MRRILVLSFITVLCLPACGKGHGGKKPPSAVGALTLMAGSRNPLASAIPSDAQDVTVLQVHLSADPDEDIRLDGVTVRSSGTGDEWGDIAGAELWLDLDADGLAGGGDTYLEGPLTYPADDGSITFTTGSMIVPAGGAADLMVVYDFREPGTAALSSTFEATLLGTDVIATGVDSGETIAVSGDPTVTGGPFTVTRVDLRIRLGVGDASIPSSTTITPGDRERPIMQFNLSASGAMANLTGITFTAAGTGDDTGDLTQVRVYLDTNGDGTVDPMLDPQVGSGPKFSSDNGAATVPLSFTIPAGLSYDFIVTYNFKSPLPSGSGSDFQATIPGGGQVTTASPLLVYGSAAGKFVAVFN